MSGQGRKSGFAAEQDTAPAEEPSMFHMSRGTEIRQACLRFLPSEFLAAATHATGKPLSDCARKVFDRPTIRDPSLLRCCVSHISVLEWYIT